MPHQDPWQHQAQEEKKRFCGLTRGQWFCLIISLVFLTDILARLHSGVGIPLYR